MKTSWRRRGQGKGLVRQELSLQIKINGIEIYHSNLEAHNNKGSRRAAKTT